MGDRTDRTERLGLPPPPARPEPGDKVRWEPTPGRVHFGQVTALQTNLRSEVIGLIVRSLGQDVTWPMNETTVVDESDPEQILEWMRG